MLPNPSPVTAAEAVEPLLEILEDAAPADLHSTLWDTCSSKRWYFGHGSNTADWTRFWKLDLDGDSGFNALWAHLRPRCEALAGGPLRVIRQYANGHTYGLGGNPHADDKRPGCFTLLYYPNPEWKDGWDGETMFYDGSGEIALAVRPRPNRAVFFDSRILHAGRAPSRICPALRVTVAYKLELADPAMPAGAEPVTIASGSSVECKEIARDGARRVYSIRVASEVVRRAVEKNLAALAKSVRVPGFRAGNIPEAVMEQRYGVQTRLDTLNRLAAEATDRLLPKGSIASAVDLKTGLDSGDLEFHVAATFLPDLPFPDFTQMTIERLTASQGDLEAAGWNTGSAAEGLRRHLNAQALDRIDAACPLPLLPAMIERELNTIRKAAASEVEMPTDAAGQAAALNAFRAIAERRLRLGIMIAEMARRLGIRSTQGPELEAMVLDHFIRQARIVDRPATPEELRALVQD